MTVRVPLIRKVLNSGGWKRDACRVFGLGGTRRSDNSAIVVFSGVRSILPASLSAPILTAHRSVPHAKARLADANHPKTPKVERRSIIESPYTTKGIKIAEIYSYDSRSSISSPPTFVV